MASPRMALRRMRESDLDAVLAVQAGAYPPAMQEAADLLRARLRSAPSTALVACLGGAVCAYVFAYPSLLGRVTPLDAPFAPAAAPDTLYLHDLAVAPHALGRGLARRMVARLLARAAADGLRHAALVSVQESRAFWESLGYREDEGRPPCAALASYPGAAIYMTRAL
jgi:ribosomal protein S18 acetylase RimI-like enzyme